MTWTPLGTEDTQSGTCGRCGKPHLRRLVVLENTDSGEIVRVGTTCAGKLIGDRRVASQAVSQADTIQEIVDRLREIGIESTKEWKRLRGIGADIRKIGNPKINVWSIDYAGQRLIVTDTVVRRDIL